MKKAALLFIIPLILIEIFASCVLGQDQAVPTESGGAVNGPVFDPDDPPETRNRLAPFLTFGGELELEYEFENNFDLDDSGDEDISNIKPELSLAFSFDPGENFQAFLETELSWDLELEGGEEAKDQFSLSIEQSYLLFKNLPDDRFSFQVGRQRFDDDREWLYDEELAVFLEPNRNTVFIDTAA